MTATALILFMHGARNLLWAWPFEAVAAVLWRLYPRQEVQLADLEFMSPGPAEAVQPALSQGAQQARLVRLFLGARGHVRNDLPVLLHTLRANHPSVHFEVGQAIGEREEAIQAVAQSIAQARSAGSAV